jgi:V8-like Glu-specific endopeptidase
MVFSNRFTATAVLSLLCSSRLATSTLIDTDFKTLLGFDPNFVSSFADSDTPIPEIIELAVEDLNGTSAPPSPDSINRLAGRDVLGGFDDRVLWPDTSYPYSAMGKLQWSNGVWCSASLIGPRHVAAAKHCAPLKDPGVSVRFSPGFYDGERFGGAWVTTVVHLAGFDVNDNPDACDWKEDWAIFIIDSRLGESQGYLGATTISDSQTNQPIFWNYGFPGDKGGNEPYVMDASKIYSGPYGCDAYGPYLTDTDVVGGQSGGPFWIPDNGWYQYAVTSGASSASSIFAGGNNWVGAVISTRNDFP